MVISPPVAVPAEVAAPALSTKALSLVLFVPMACVTDRLPSAAKLMVPPVIETLRSTAKSLPAPVMVALTLPAPVMVLAMVVSAERTYLKVALLLSVTSPTPKVPVLPPLPTCKVPPLMVVVPA